MFRKSVVWILSAFLLLSLHAAFAQKEEKGHELQEIDLRREDEILNSIKELDKAMVSSDTSTLNTLLSKEVHFKHSNGMVESKTELLNNLNSGYLRYLQIEQQGKSEIGKWKGKKGGYWKDHTVTRDLHVVGELDGKPFDVVLTTKEHWVLVDDKNKWVLLERQSVQADK